MKPESHLTPEKLNFVLNYLMQVGFVPGMIIEIGCYKGGTLAAMAEKLPWRRMIGFDTFGGLPELHDKDKCENPHAAGDFSDIPKDIASWFAPNGIPLIAAMFPFNVPPIPTAFAHLDVDLY
jgi:hypothetical protein